MNSHYYVLLFILCENCFGFKNNHQIAQQAKSIFSNKKCKELFTPARYKVGMKNIMLDCPASRNMPEQYFPDVEYPMNIMESCRPFFYKTGESNAMLGSFPDDVKTSYKTLMEINKKSLEEIKQYKYMNEYAPNSENCLQENTNSTPKEETVCEEATLKENNDDVFVAEGEVIINEVSQNMVASDKEDIAEAEMGSNDSSSESEETIENEESGYIIKQEPPAINEGNEEEAVAEGYFQSWESEQYNGIEIITQISEGENMDPEMET